MCIIKKFLKSEEKKKKIKKFLFIKYNFWKRYNFYNSMNTVIFSVFVLLVNTFISKYMLIRFAFLKFLFCLRFQLRIIVPVFFKKTARSGFFFLSALFISFFFDALISDDEPLWEPIEWSLWQSWLFFIFFFSWIAENLITSRYGSYTGRDKRVWFAWYKCFKLFEMWWMTCTAIAAIFVITPFYFEITYTIAQPILYWDWYNRVFFAKFCGLFFCILSFSNVILLGIRWLNWKKHLILAIIISLLLFFLLYLHFITILFAYFTDNMWYKKSIWAGYLGMSHEPSKWSWGPKDRDHFTYHRTPTIFWYKNDLPYAAALFFIHLFFFTSLMLVYWQWLLFIRKIYSTKEVTYTFAVFAVSTLRHFYFMSFGFFVLSLFSVCFQFLRYPAEFLWFRSVSSWATTLFDVLLDFPFFLLNLFC